MTKFSTKKFKNSRMLKLKWFSILTEFRADKIKNKEVTKIPL